MVAVFGSIQMAVSRVINLQHHRIAQVGPGGVVLVVVVLGGAEPGAAAVPAPTVRPRSAAW